MSRSWKYNLIKDCCCHSTCNCCYGSCLCPCAAASVKTHFDGSNWWYNLWWLLVPCPSVTVFNYPALRNYIRQGYNLEGNTCSDCCLSLFCTPCVITQLLNEVADRGPRKSPLPFAERAEGVAADSDGILWTVPVKPSSWSTCCSNSISDNYNFESCLTCCFSQCEVANTYSQLAGVPMWFAMLFPLSICQLQHLTRKAYGISADPFVRKTVDGANNAVPRGEVEMDCCRPICCHCVCCLCTCNSWYCCWHYDTLAHIRNEIAFRQLAAWGSGSVQDEEDTATSMGGALCHELHPMLASKTIAEAALAAATISSRGVKLAGIPSSPGKAFDSVEAAGKSSTAMVAHSPKKLAAPSSPSSPLSRQPSQPSSNSSPTPGRGTSSRALAVGNSSRNVTSPAAGASPTNARLGTQVSSPNTKNVMRR